MLLNSDGYLKLPLPTPRDVPAHRVLKHVFWHVTDQHYQVLSLSKTACACFSAATSQEKVQGTDPR